MGFLIFLVTVVILAVVLFSAWLLLFSRHGGRLRGEVSEYLSEFPLNPAFGRSYLRTMNHAGGGMSEQIELQDMLEDSNHEE